MANKNDEQNQSFIIEGEPFTNPLLDMEDEIFKYIRKGDLSKVKAHVNKGANINIFNSQGETPLDVAAKLLDQEREKMQKNGRRLYDKLFHCYDFLRKNHAKTSKTLFKEMMYEKERFNRFVEDVVRYAQTGTFAKVVHVLKGRWEKDTRAIEERRREADQLIDLAFENKLPVIVKALTSVGYDIHQSARDNPSLLNRALAEKNVPLFECALELGALDIYPEIKKSEKLLPEQTALVQKICSTNDFRIVKAFLTSKYSKHLDSETLLTYAMEQGLADTANAICKTKKTDKIKALTTLLTTDYTANHPYKQSKVDVIEANKQRHLIASDLLFSIAAETDVKDIPTEMAFFILDKRVQQLPAYPNFLTKILSSSRLVNAVNEDGVPLLSKALSCGVGEKDRAEALIKVGTSLETKDHAGFAPIHYAASHGLTSTLELLLQKGVSPDTTDNKGNTALHVSARHNLLPILRALLENGADINAQNNNGETPLITAAQNTALNTMQYLLKHKDVDLLAVSNDNKTYVDYFKAAAIKTGTGYSLISREEKRLAALKNKNRWQSRLHSFINLFRHKNNSKGM